MYKKILVTGGAGFIGSHLVDGLIKKKYQVRILDNLTEQIHPGRKKPAYLNKKAEFIFGDVTNKQDVLKSLKGVDAVFHLAAAVGVGQSMYEIAHYSKVNCYGTGLLLEAIANAKKQIKKIVVAASMSSYGEGLYRCVTCGIVQPSLRLEEKLSNKDFNNYCPSCGRKIIPVPTDEEAKQNSNSVYAINKKDQEQMVLVVGKAYDIPSIALRYFNVYGPRQSLSNPYNGVAAIFMSRIKNSKPPIINEDGLQTRDFIHVKDVTQANIAALETDSGNYESYNVGSGIPVTIKEVAHTLARLQGSSVKPELTQKCRKLDVRHCYADIKKINKKLGWKPTISFENGMKQVVNWAKDEEAIDRVDVAMQELLSRGLR